MLALRDVTVTATLTNGKTRVLEPSEYTLEGFDTTKLGEQTVTVRLVADSSVTATFTVTVESNLARLFCSSAAASKYEPASSWASASTADLTCDNNLSTNWSNWGTGDTSRGSATPSIRHISWASSALRWIRPRARPLRRASLYRT